jgi:hypothetical protein
VATSVNWKERSLSIRLELDLGLAGLKMPEARLEAERMVEKDLPGLAKDAVFSIQADSYRSVGDAVATLWIESEDLLSLASLAKPSGSTFSKDLRKFVSVYTLSLDDLTTLFLNGARPSPVRESLQSMPTRAYSGVIVYAKGDLPVHGETVAGRATPCLFPRIYDSDMNLVLDRSVVAPEALSGKDGGGGGVLGYSDGLGAEAGSRVGADPLRVMALELFGDSRTDYVISREDALRILSSPGNRELLSRGRVVVVLDFQH